jgi:hypothetical protein
MWLFYFFIFLKSDPLQPCFQYGMCNLHLEIQFHQSSFPMHKSHQIVDHIIFISPWSNGNPYISYMNLLLNLYVLCP